MTHWIIAPIVLPAFLAPFIVLAARHHIGIQRVFSITGVVALVVLNDLAVLFEFGVYGHRYRRPRQGPT